MSGYQFGAGGGPGVPAWPALDYEVLPWEPKEAWGVGFTRREQRAQASRYQAAVPPPIAGRDLPLSGSLAAAVSQAATDIVRFDGEAGSEIAPFSAILLRSESAASSRIENLSASARSIGQAELGDTSKVNATLIAANTAAMRAALALAEHLDADAILAMHAALMTDDEHHEAGAWRREPVWVGGSHLGPGGADFVAPHHDRIPGCIDDLVAYLRRDDVPFLAQAAVAHAQFETIHPFTDGNGRTGRALMHAMLRNKGLTRAVTVPVSAGLLSRTNDYYDALTAYRAGDPEPIVTLTAQASSAAIANGRQLVAELQEIRHAWRNRVRARPQARTWDVIDLLLRQPVVSARVLGVELGIAPGHVRRHMDVLEHAGVVKVAILYGHGVYWRADEVLTALDRFANRARRRARSGRP